MVTEVPFGNLHRFNLFEGLKLNTDKICLVYMKYAQDTQDVKYNVLIVDWSSLSTSRLDLALTTKSYTASVKNVRIVGKRIANMINFLLSQKLLYTTEHVHLIGHSMGAHIAGYTGYELQKIANSSIGRITGILKTCI